jgi:23S rRNA (cytidine1920-2'-O)/16S rRNA (cytidine1409-2'-O)-methyltransferase
VTRIRLDSLLVDKGLAESRHRAKAIIMSGQVTVDGLVIDKPGREVPMDCHVIVREALRYVSRGGLKLEAALDRFGIDPSGLNILDAGASTGGFTDCLLARGASRVVAVDVGYGQFHWNLRNDPRVVIMERVNFRFFTPDMLSFGVQAAVADLSFISLKLVMANFRLLIPSGGWFLPLVKPQFEVGRRDVGKGGVVRDQEKIMAAVESIKSEAGVSGFDIRGEMESPVRGPKGNREFFIFLVAK